MDCSAASMEYDHDETMDRSSDTLTNSDDEDVSLIEYARYYGLSKDYTTFDPLSPHILHSISAWKPLDLDITQLPQFKLPDRIDLDEKWTIDLQSAIFLKQIASLEVAPIPEIKRQRNISADYKIEPQLLPTDPDFEQRRFIRARNSRLNQASHKLLPEALWQHDEEAPLYWPEPDLPTTLIEQIKNERLQLDKNDILFLQQCISVSEQPELQDIDVLPHKKARQEYEAARHTSPLLPCSSPFQFSAPDSPVSRIPLATSPIDPVPAEIARIESTMDLDDDFSLDGLSDISAFDIASTSETRFSSPLKRKRPEDYKVEVPLSPALQSSSPLKKLKMVTFSDELCTTIPEYAKPFSSDNSNGTDEVGNFLEQVIKPGAHSALLAINSEQLTQADSVLRVEVPTIDLTSPSPPWKVFARESWDSQTELEAQQRLISMLKREFVRPHEERSNVGKADRAMSRWRPFDMQLSELPVEDIHCDYLDEFGSEEPQDTTSGWKLDGLRVLDAREDDDELMEAVDMSTMLGNLDLIDGLPERSASGKVDSRQSAGTPYRRQPFSSLSNTNNDRSNTMRSNESSVAAQTQAPSTCLVSASLDHYMELCTGNKIAAQKTKPQTQTVLENVHKPDTHTARESDVAKTTSSRPMHLPALPASMPPRTFVLSLTVAARRYLVKEISRLSSMAEYIVRDLTPPQVLHGVTSHTSEADEADLILAPGHGLMLTTLQKLMQKSLPGQVTRNVIRERVVQLARRYERLVIMVHEERSGTQQRPLDNRECSELASLINFCAAQNHDIQVMYVPGDESALATWIVASIVRFGLDDPEVQLQEASSWELFLRKAGMDVFAAQMVLIKLKVPDSMPASTTEQHYGLPAFIMMSEAERLGRFGALFGGEKILRRVSMAIDGSWTRDVVAGDLRVRKL